MKITLCSSAYFYKDLFPILDELVASGHEVLVPITADKMRAANNYDVDSHRTWMSNPADFGRKSFLMKHHLEKIREGDVILVVNLEKKGIKGYVGGNVLLEMFHAWLLGKPIYLLHPVTQELSLYEEVLGMQPVCIDGDLSRIV